MVALDRRPRRRDPNGVAARRASFDVQELSPSCWLPKSSETANGNFAVLNGSGNADKKLPVLRSGFHDFFQAPIFFWQNIFLFTAVYSPVYER